MARNAASPKPVAPSGQATLWTYNSSDGLVWGLNKLLTMLAPFSGLGNSVGCACFACLVGGHFSCENLVLDVDARSGLGPVAFYTVPRVCRPADQHGTRPHRPVPSQSTLTPSQVNVSTSIDLDHVETLCTSPRAHNTSWTLPWVGRSRQDVKEPFLLSGCRANTSKHVRIA
jgi:hypothetical protein